MNETKVVFKDKSEIKDFILKTYKASPHDFSFILEEESQNLYFKGLLMETDSAISDRQMRTMKSEIYRQITQDFGYRVVRDEHLAYYLFEEKSGKLFKKLSKHLKILSSLPDYFFDEAFSLPLDEYLLETDNVELLNLSETLVEAKILYEKLINNKIVSASTTEVLVDHLRFKESDKIIIFESYFNRLPEVLKENLRSAHLTLLSFKESINWKTQLDLYDALKDREGLYTINFSDPIKEVRFLLEKIKDSPDSTLVLFPKNKGYENLFNIYQREFFDEIKTNKKVKKSSKIRKAVDILRYSQGEVDPYTYFRAIADDPNFSSKQLENLNRVNFSHLSKNKEENKKILFKDYIDLLNEKNNLSDELDFISEIQLSLPTDLSLTESDWCELILISLSPNSKDVKLVGDLNLRKVEQSIDDEFSEIYFCGWSEENFKPSLTSVISQKTLSLIEKDLGFQAWSVEKSIAKKVFLDQIFLNQNINIYFSTPKVDLSGKIIEKSVFNYLLEKKSVLEVKPPIRIKRNDIDYKENELTKNTDYGLSASSLSLYDECPFKFYMYKVLGLVQKNAEDYFLDPLLEGSLIHELLENFLKEDIKKDDFILKVLELSKSKNSEFNVFKAPYVEKIAERVWDILLNEKEHLRENNINVYSIEKSFSFFADVGSRSLTKRNTNLKIRGKIDRIDKDLNDNMLIYDYKRGASGISMFKNYGAKELKPQLFLYCLAAQEGFLGEFNDLVGFQYINTTEQKRAGGYINKKFKGEGIVKEASAQTFIDETIVEEKMALFLDKFWQSLDLIDKGYFEPKPRSHDICQKCEWKASCRKSETFL